MAIQNIEEIQICGSLTIKTTTYKKGVNIKWKYTMHFIQNMEIQKEG